MKIVALSGYGDLPGSDPNSVTPTWLLPGAALIGWTAILAVTGYIFWATLHPPRLPRA